MITRAHLAGSPRAMSLVEWARGLISPLTDVLNMECRACGSADLEVRDDSEYCRDCGAKNR